jgi:hypothetical protein
MAGPSKLLSEVRASARALGVAAAWAGSRRSVRVEEDFIYEMYVLFQIVDDLIRQYTIHYLPGSGTTKHAFPRNPAKKKGRPRFHVIDTTTQDIRWQLCAGTKIEDIDGNQHGVDISLQAATSPEDSPTHFHTLIAWECKYKKRPKDRVTKPEFLSFAGWIELLGLQGGAKAQLNLQSYAALDSNALVTNGRECTLKSKTRNRYQLREISNFSPGNAHKIHT